MSPSCSAAAGLSSFSSFSGIVGGDEFCVMPVLPGALRRMSVLGFNLVLIALGFGRLAPLVLRKFEIDPARAAPPSMTCLSDRCGFLIFLTMAARLHL